MALKKEINKAGHIFEYWKITNVHISILNNRVNVEISGYANRESSKNNPRDFIQSDYFSFKYKDTKDIENNIVEECYKKAKQESFWSESEDILE